MKHEWERHPDSETIRRPMQKWRCCKRCGVEQQHTTDHEWGRVVGYNWWPKVGRCLGRPTVRVFFEENGRRYRKWGYTIELPGSMKFRHAATLPNKARAQRLAGEKRHEMLVARDGGK